MAQEDHGLGPESHESIPDPDKYGLIIHRTVFVVAAVLIFIFIGMALADFVVEKYFVEEEHFYPEEEMSFLEYHINSIQGFIAEYFGWFYIMTVALILGFVIWLAFSRYGNIPLGPNDSEPDYSYFTWFTMLFSAGMGIGLLFYSVAEPLTHYMNPPLIEGGSGRDAALQAFNLTYFHWGIHPWAVYSLVGATLAYFGFRRGQPLTLRSAFYPLLGERVHGLAGNIIDVIAVVGTLFGVATSLGLGVIQVNRGLEYAFGLTVAPSIQILLIAAITAVATISVVLGLDVGIRRLSEWNISVALVMAIALLLVGPTLFIFNVFVQNFGYYVQHIVQTTTWTATFEGSDWLADWTVFYWAWWIAWSPFVGMFIARISRGRTIREFIMGTMLAPMVATFAWMSVFGGSAIYIEMFEYEKPGDVAHVEEYTDMAEPPDRPEYEERTLAEQVVEDVDVALFALLEHFPLYRVTWLIAVVLIAGFFVTSSDSASMVISILTAGGHPEPPTAQRVFWAILEGAVAATLIGIGGLAALQSGAITTGLPLAIVLILMAISLYKGVRQERAIRLSPVYLPPEEYEELTSVSDTDSSSSSDDEDDEDEQDEVEHNEDENRG